MCTEDSVSEMTRFNTDEDERLIELVRVREFMWNMRDPGFKDHVKRDATWRKIAQMINKPRIDVQKRWKHMRDHYRRQMKEEATTGTCSVKKRAIYWTKLQFLNTEGGDLERNSFSKALPVSVQLNSDENSSSDTGIHAMDSNSLEHAYEVDIDLEPPSKKRRENSSLMQYLADTEEDKNQFKKFLRDLMKSTTQEDEIDLFFKSMAMTVKKFRPELVTKAKVKVFETVMEMEVLNQTT